MNKRVTSAILIAAGFSLGAASCSSTSNTATTPGTTAAGTGTTAAGTGTTKAGSTGTTKAGSTGTSMKAMEASIGTASELNTGLTLLLQEHVILAAQATDAALAGRTPEFEAAAGALDENSKTLSGAIGLIYGEEAGSAFYGLWKTHIDLVVEYTKAVAAKDTAKQEEIAGKLVQYATDFAAFLNGANPDLPKDAVTELVKTHILTLKKVIDDQASGDWTKAYASLYEAVDHMHMISDPLSAAIAKQFPDKFPGNPTSKAAGLDQALNSLLQQHVAYAAIATGNALGGREDQYKAAVELLAQNTTDLSTAVGSVVGTEAGTAFKGSWEKHIGFFVDYTQGVAGDAAKKATAAKALEGYAGDLAAFFNSALPDLPKATLEGLIKGHITSLEKVIDAQGAKDYKVVYTELPMAMAHMTDIGTPLAAGIAKAMPDKFPTS